MAQSTISRRVIIAGTIGNVLEWYDFAIYGYFATQIGKQFFPAESAAAQILATFGIFAIGYLMRPVGGIIVGHIGDKYGRQAALTFSIAAMAIPTFLIGILPGYAAIGFAAPAILTLLRMMQGLSVGGEYASSMIFMIEQAPMGRRGLMGGLAGASALLGTLLGSAAGAVLASSMSTEALENWGWRIPFLVGLIVGIAGYFIRKHAVENETIEQREMLPIVETLKFHWKEVLRFIGVSFFHAGTFFIILVFLVSWAQTYNGSSPARALTINTVSMAMSLIVTFTAGNLSDRLGRKFLMIIACAFSFLFAIPLFWLMHGAMFWYGNPHLLLGQVIFSVLLGLYYGCLPTFLVELAPPSVRCTAVALGYNLCYGLLGGISPLAAAWLIKNTDYPSAPAIWIMCCAAVTLLTLMRTRETHPASNSSG